MANLPSYLGKGTFASGTTSAAPGVPAGITNEDFLVMLVHTPNQAVTTPAGWTLLAPSPVSTGTASTALGVRLTVFYKSVAGIETAPTVSVSGGTATAAIIFAFRGVNLANPFNVTPTSRVDAAGTTAMSWQTLTTTANNVLILMATANDHDLAGTAGVGNVTAAGLTSITEAHDQTVATGSGGGVHMAYGTRATAGAIGTMTATGAASAAHAYLTIPLQAAEPVVRTVGQYEDDFATVVGQGASTTDGESTNIYLQAEYDSGVRTMATTPKAEIDPVATAFNGTANSTLRAMTQTDNTSVTRNMRGSQMIYDSHNKRLVLFGGYDGTTRWNEVWHRYVDKPGQPWRRLTVSGTAPTGRNLHGMTYVKANLTSGGAVRAYAIIWGGADPADKNDMFSLRLDTPGSEAWTTITQTSAPTTRSYISGQLVATPGTDSSNNYIYLYGGWAAARENQLVRCTFDVDAPTAVTWTTLKATGAVGNPSATTGAIMDYKASTNKLYLYGGYSGAAMLNQFWEYDIAGNTWTNTSPTGTAPTASEAGAGGYDAANNRFWFTGGWTTNGTFSTSLNQIGYINDVGGSESYVLVRSNTALDSDQTYVANSFPAFAVNPDLGYLMLKGMATAETTSTANMVRYGYIIDFNEGATSEFPVYGETEGEYYNARDAVASVWNPKEQEWLAIGGYDDMYDDATIVNGTHSGDIWVYNEADNTWRYANKGFKSLPPVEGRVAAYDTLRDRVLVFGGLTAETENSNEIWELIRDSNGNYEAKPLRPTGTKPQVRWLGAACYDDANDRFIIALGGDGAGAQNNVWACNFSGSAQGAWTQLTPSGSVTGVIGVGFADKKSNKRLYIFGGATNSLLTTVSSQLCYLDYSTTNCAWTVVTTVSATARRTPAMDIDNTQDQLVVFGGFNGTNVINTTSYYNLASGNTWVNAAPALIPDARRSAHGQVINGRFFLSAGRPNTGTWYRNTWQLEPNYTTPNSSIWTNKFPPSYTPVYHAFTGGTNGTSYHWQAWTTEGSIDSPKSSYPYRVTTYTFDASDAAVSDPNNVWTDDGFGADGRANTVALTTTLGSTSSNFLQIQGTTAPSTGRTITQVRARVLGPSFDYDISAAIYTDGLAQLLGTATLAAGSSSYTTLSTPTGGWTWAKLQALETKVYATTAFAPARFTEVEIEVTTSNAESDADFIIGSGGPAQFTKNHSTDANRKRQNLTVLHTTSANRKKAFSIAHTTSSYLKHGKTHTTDALKTAGTTILSPTFDASSAGTNSGRLTSWSWNHTVANQTNRLLIVTVTHDTADTVTSITFNGDALTQLVAGNTTGTGNNIRQEMWYMLAPDIGTFSIQVNISGSGVITNGAAAVSYYNVSALDGTNFGGAVFQTSPSISTTTSEAGAITIGTDGNVGDGRNTPDSGWNERIDQSSASSGAGRGMWIADQVYPSAGTRNLAATVASRNYITWASFKGVVTVAAREFRTSHTTDAYKSISVPTFTKTHTTSANKKKANNTLTHTTSAVKRKATTVSHTTSANKKAALTRTHTTNALKRKQFTVLHTTSANKKKAAITLSHTTSANKKKADNLVAHTTSANKKVAGNTRTHTTSALKISSTSLDQSQREDNTNLLFGDASVQRVAQRFTPSITGRLSSIMVVINNGFESTDTLVMKVYSNNAGQPGTLLTTSTNAADGSSIPWTDPNLPFLFTFDQSTNLTSGTPYWFTLERTGALDGSNNWLVRYDTVTSYGTTNDLLYYNNSSVWATMGDNTDLWFYEYYVAVQTLTKTHTTSANKRKATTVSHTTSANKKRAFTVAHTTSANKKAATTKTHTTSSVLRKAFTVSHSTSANKKLANNTRTHTTDALKRVSGIILTHTTNALLRKQFTVAHSTSANKRKATLVSHTADANKRRAYTVSHTTSANKKVSGFTVSHTTSANKRVTGNLRTHTTNSFLRKAFTVSHTTSSNKKVSGFTRTHTTNALKRGLFTRTHTTDSFKRLRSTVSHTTDARPYRRLFSELIDNFDDNSVDSTKWEVGSYTHSETGGKAYFGLADIWDFRVRSAHLRSLIGNEFYLQWGPMPISQTTAIIELENSAGTGHVVRLEYSPDSGSVNISNASFTSLGSFTYNAVTTAWIRLRESGGTFYVETATHPSSGWTVRYSGATLSGMDNARFQARYGNAGANLSKGGIEGWIDNFNTAGAQFTVSHTTDALKNKQAVLTHSTNALKRKATTVTHTTNALKRKVTLVSHTTSANRRKATLVSHTTDANRRKALTVFHTTSANKRKVTSVAHTTDANKKLANNTRTHTTNALLRQAFTASHTTSAVLRKLFTKTHTTNALLRKQFTLAHTTSANKRKAFSVAHTADANKKKTNNLVTHTTDALKRKVFTLSHTTDASIRPIRFTISHTTNSFLRRAVAIAHTTNALKRKAFTLLHTTDANKKRAYTVAHSTSANKKQAAITRSHTTNALLRRQLTLTHSTNALKRTLNVLTHSTNSFLRKAFTVSHTTSSNKRKVNTLSHTTSANKRKLFTLSHSTDTLLRSSNVLSHTTDTLKRTLTQVAHTTDAFLRKRIALTHTTDSNKKRAYTVAHTTSANKRLATLRSHTTDALKRKAFTLSHSTNALLRKAFTVSHTTNAFKRTRNVLTHSTNSLLRKAFTVQHTTSSNKRKAFTASHSTNALKRTLNVLSHTTNALKRKEFTLSHSTDSFLRQSIELVHSTSSFLRKGNAVSHTTDANKRRAYTVSHTTSSNKKRANLLLTHTTNALLRKLFTVAHTTDTLKRTQNVVAHTTDSFLRLRRTVAHTTSANLRKVFTTSHSTSSNKRKAFTVVHSTSANKRRAYSVSHTTSAIKRAIRTVSHTTNALLRSRVALTHTTNSLLRSLNVLLHTTDSNKRKAFTTQHSTSANKRKENVLTHTTNSFLRTRVGVSHSTDANRKKAYVVSHLADAFKRTGNEVYHNTDANKKRAQFVSHTTDSNKKLANNIVSHLTDALKATRNVVAHSTDSNKRKATIVQHTTDSLLRTRSVIAHTTDTLKRTANVISHSTSSLLRKAYSVSHSTSANKRKATTISHTTDANKRKAYVISHTTNANKRKAYIVSHSTSANKKKAANVVSHTTNSLLRRILTLTHTTNALKRKLFVLTHSTSALLRKANVIVHTTSSNKRKATQLSHTTDSLLRTANELAHSTDSNKRKATEIEHTTDSLIAAPGSLTHETDANKRTANNVVDHSTDALKRTAVEVEHTTDALLRERVVIEHSTDSFLRKTRTVAHSTSSVLRRANIVAHTTSAVKRAVNALQHTTDSLLKQRHTTEHSTDAFLREQRAVQHSTNANKKRGTSVEHTTDASLYAAAQLTHSTDASLVNPRGKKKVLIDGVWQVKPVKVLVDGEWVVATVKYFDGTTWVTTTY